jgi:SWIM zinc finger
MSTVATAPPVRPIRHGVHALRLRIGATWYQLRAMPAPAGFRTVWTLRKLDREAPAATYSVAQAKGEDARCTCPDHELNGALCKHVMALAAAGLIKQPKAARPKPEKAPSARARKAHAKTARAIIAECKALDPAARRHLAAMGPEPALALPEGWQPGGSPVHLPSQIRHWTLERIHETALPVPQELVCHPNVGIGHPPAAKALPPAPDGSFTAGFRAAVETHLAVRRGELIECAACRYPFDPEAEGSAPLALCGPCLAEEKGGRS